MGCARIVLLLGILAIGMCQAAEPTIKYVNCGCTGKEPDPCIQDFNSGDCRAGSQGSIVKSRRVRCLPQTAMCARFSFFDDEQCLKFQKQWVPVCNTCLRMKDNQTAFLRVMCNHDSQTISVDHHCDEGCNNCVSGGARSFKTCHTSPLGNYMNSGIFPCAAVEVSAWMSDASCAGTPDVSENISQTQCTEHGFFTCTPEPEIPPEAPDLPAVLIADCEHGGLHSMTCDRACSYKTVPSGACVPDLLGGASRLTCVQGLAYCVTEVFFNNTDCTNPGMDGMITFACDKCQRPRHLNGEYVNVKCDKSTGALTVDGGCDASCKTCTNKSMIQRNPYVCYPSTRTPGLGIFTVGIHPCALINEEMYTSSSCLPGTLVGSLAMGLDECDVGQYMSCGNYDLQSITELTCRCNEETGCSPKVYPTGSCQPSGANSSYSVQCAGEAMCADLVFFNDSSCNKEFLQFTQPVCGSCNLWGDTYVKISCDLESQVVTAMANCKADCSDCQGGMPMQIPFDTCVQHPAPNMGYMFNQGLAPCTSTMMRVWDNNANCEGAPDHYSAMAEGNCHRRSNARFRCGNEPVYNKTDVVQGKTQVLAAYYQEPFCSNGAVNVTYFESGVCNSDLARVRPNKTMAEAWKYTCLQSSMCARAIWAGNGEDCMSSTNTDVEIWSAPCGSCSRYYEDEYWHTGCDLDTEEIYFDGGCNSNCSKCTKMHTRVYDTGLCEPAEWNPTEEKVMNLGLFQCNLVRIEDFGFGNCDPQSLLTNYTIAQGRCDYGMNLRCGKFNVPPTAATTILQESCPPSKPFPPMTIQTDSCIKTSYKDDNDQWTNISYSFSCPVDIQLCGMAYMFNDSICHTYLHPHRTFACGSCLYAGEEQGYISISCNTNTQEVSVFTGCDRMCQSCKSDPIKHPVNRCVPSVKKGEYGIVAGLYPCEMLIVNQYLNSDSCEGVPYTYWEEQTACHGGGSRMTCSNAPKKHTEQFNGASILHTTCSDDKCRGGCESISFPQGDCIPDPVFETSKRVTCLKESMHCAMFQAWNGVTCADRQPYQETFYAIGCNQCTPDPWGKTGQFAKPQCDFPTQTITWDTGCDAQCGNCKHHFAQTVNATCGDLPDNVGSGFLWGIEACMAYRIEQYSDVDCSAAKLTANLTKASMACENGQRYQCGNFTPTLKQKVAVSDCNCWEPGKNCNVAPQYDVNQCTPFKDTSVKFSCGPRMCASLMIYNQSTCSQETAMHGGVRTAVCGECLHVGGDEWLQVDCSTPASDTMSIQVQKCSARCSSCTGGASTVYLDQCRSLPIERYGTLEGIAYCSAVLVEEWSKSDCTGDHSHYIVPQATCMNGTRLTCTPVMVPDARPTSVSTVLMNRCTDFGCSGDCAAETAPSGACVLSPFGSMRSTCDSKPRLCANMRLFGNPDCQETVPGGPGQRGGFQGVFTAACGTCDQEFSTGDFFFIRCDPETGMVYTSRGCDSQCKKCTEVDALTHPFMQCSPSIRPGTSVVQLGLSPCYGVRQEMFMNSLTCEESKRGMVMEMAEGVCLGHSSVTCGNFDLESVLLNKCYCDPATDSKCWKISTMSGACTRLDNTSSMRIDCSPTPAKCAVFSVFNSTTSCDKWMERVIPVCDTCLLTPDLGYVKLECDQTKDEATVTPHCTDKTCTSCTGKSVKYPCDKSPECPKPRCQSLSKATDYMLLWHGLEDCDAALLSQWLQSDNCSGDPQVMVPRAQGLCANGYHVTCANAPLINRNPKQNKTQVLHSECQGEWCTTNCTQHLHHSGVCATHNSPTGEPVNSSRYTCGTGGFCASIWIYEGETCEETQGKSRHISVVCNSCMKTPDGFVLSTCDTMTERVFFASNCDSKCSNCSHFGNFTPLERCTKTMHPGFSMKNHGVYPCSSIQIEEFWTPDCDSRAIVRNYSTSQGECDKWFGRSHSYVCGEFNLPSGDIYEQTVTEYPCDCPDDDCPEPQVYKEGTCMKYDESHSYSVGCSEAVHYCVTVNEYSSKDCTELSDTTTSVCNSCTRRGDSVFYVACDLSTETALLYGPCNDTCKNCGPGIGLKPTLSIPFMGCHAGPPVQQTPVWYQNFGIAACDAVSIFYYDNTDCWGDPRKYQLLEQFIGCELLYGNSFACSAPPVPKPIITSPYLRRTECPGDFCEGTDCVTTVVGNGACVKVSDSLSRRATCAGTAQCAEIQSFPPGKCTLNKEPGTRPNVFTLGCGSCLKAGNEYIKVLCDVLSQHAFVARECKEGCNSCEKNISVARGQCTSTGKADEDWALRSISACQEVSVQEYKSPNCDVSTQNLDYMAGDGHCEQKVTYRCGYVPGYTTPPPFTNPTKGPAAESSNAGTVVLVIFIVLIALVGGVFGVRFLTRRNVKGEGIEEPLFNPNEIHEMT